MALFLHVMAAVWLGLFGCGAGFGWRYGVVGLGVVGVLAWEVWAFRKVLSGKKASGWLVPTLTKAHMAVSLLVLGGVVWEIFGR
jgi:hypothetical protein